VLIVDAEERFLLQRRAQAKTRFAHRWGNACCGHPAPGEDVSASARRRLREELGLTLDELTPVGVHLYRAGDSRTGRVEHEYDHVLVGRVPVGTPLTPDPAEVSELRWAALEELHTALRTTPAQYVPWLAGVLSVWRRAVTTEFTGGR
jgi:isopentenyl-diphosphate delta-isomerase